MSASSEESRRAPVASGSSSPLPATTQLANESQVTNTLRDESQSLLAAYLKSSASNEAPDDIDVGVGRLSRVADANRRPEARETAGELKKRRLNSSTSDENTIQTLACEQTTSDSQSVVAQLATANYHNYAQTTFCCLKQDARPRSWCLAIVSNKYPLRSTHTHFFIPP